MFFAEDNFNGISVVCQLTDLTDRKKTATSCTSFSHKNWAERLYVRFCLMLEEKDLTTSKKPIFKLKYKNSFKYRLYTGNRRVLSLIN